MFKIILKPKPKPIPILQNSKLNREKFVKNKKLYIESICKNRQQNYNKIITRKMSCFSYTGYSFYEGGNGGGPKDIIYMFVLAFSCDICVKFMKNTNIKE
jgi:hypothetical protein